MHSGHMLKYAFNILIIFIDISFQSLRQPDPSPLYPSRGMIPPPGLLTAPPRGELPTPEELLAALQTQTAQVQQLENENKYCRVFKIFHSWMCLIYQYNEIVIVSQTFYTIFKGVTPKFI